MANPNDNTASRRPWNKGRLIGQKPPLKLKEIWSIRIHLQIAANIRELAMFNIAIDSKLRACDLVSLRVDDVALGGRARARTIVMQRKTGHSVQFEITEQTRDSLMAWIRARGLRSGDPLFPSKPIGVRQYASPVDRWIGMIGLDPIEYGTHSMRRTKAALIYRRTGNIRAVQLLLGCATSASRSMTPWSSPNRSTLRVSDPA